MNSSEPFKVCPMCSSSWGSRNDFLSDPAVELIGYQVHFADLKLGYFMFAHDVCGTTMALVAETFSDLYSEQPFSKCLAGSDECPTFCLHENELSPCPVECECAYVREIMQTIRHWPKTSSIQPAATV